MTNVDETQKRFIVARKSDGAWVCSVFADRFELYDGTNSFTGARGGHFYDGTGRVVASVELAEYDVHDSGGRAAKP
jgi:hypothetical protein